LGLVMTRGFDSSLDTRLASVQLTPAARATVDAGRDRLALDEAPSGAPAATRDQVRTAVRDAFDEGYREVMLLSAGLAAGAAVAAWFGLRAGPRRPQDLADAAASP
ncbi:MAG TPA: hypothetical protein VFO60_04140, partial [Candidatus Dormibacteraeota bacterium]|nr:hypothetical protein [Candidatus Dormibacteraeota bacterium]